MVLATAWLLSVPQGTLSQANAQAQSPSPGPSDRTTAIPDQKLDAAAAILERIASLKKDYEEQMVEFPPPTRSGLLPRPSCTVSDKVASIAGAARNEHRKRTVPWTYEDVGAITAEGYAPYKTAMAKYEPSSR